MIIKTPRQNEYEHDQRKKKTKDKKQFAWIRRIHEIKKIPHFTDKWYLSSGFFKVKPKTM